MLTSTDPLIRLWRSVSIGIVLLASSSVFAQDGGTVTDVWVEDPLKAVAGGAEAVVKGDWWAVAAAVVSVLTFALRSGVLVRLPTTGPLAFLGRAGNWLYTNPVASFVTPFALSAILGLVTTFMNGTPFTLRTLLQEVLKVGAGAVAAFIAVEKIKEAKHAGVMAAAGITSQQEALDELRKRVLKGEIAAAQPTPPLA